jgi:2-oxoglutarate ferredoxin oxidoreductase subunit gamma
MTEKIIIAGSGGQGIMRLGKVLAEAVMRENKFVTWMPSYGAEVRGGTAHCMVVISDEEIGSPYVDTADTLIIMNAPSMGKFKNRLDKKGLLLVNSSLAAADKDSKAKKVEQPFTDIAIKLGNIKIANMVALGCFISKKNIVKLKTVSQVISDIAPQDKKNLVEINQKALQEGAKLS